MAELIDLYKSQTDAFRNKVAAAGWNKAKELLVAGTPTPADLGAAKILLNSKTPPNTVLRGALVLLQDNSSADSAEIQTAVDTVVDKLIDVGI